MPELSPIQSQVLAGLLAGGSIAAVAREHKIHRSTIYNWRHEHAAFVFALTEARTRQKAALYDGAQDLAARAFETLGALLNSDCDQIRIRAAQVVLKAAGQGTSATEAAAEFPRGFEVRLQRQAAVAKLLPQDLPLLSATTPADYPDAILPAKVDTIRHISTLETVSSVESTSETALAVTAAAA